MKIKMISDVFITGLEEKVNKYLETLEDHPKTTHYYYAHDVKIIEYRSGYLATIILRAARN